MGKEGDEKIWNKWDKYKINCKMIGIDSKNVVWESYGLESLYELFIVIGYIIGRE